MLLTFIKTLLMQIFMAPDFYPHTFHIVSSSDGYSRPPVFFLILYPETLVTRNPVASAEMTATAAEHYEHVPSKQELSPTPTR